jgi:sodium transport system permease protein
MRFPQLRTIYLREMRDILRDRRTLFVMIVLPILLYPLLMIGVVQVSVLQTKKMEEEEARIALIGQKAPDELRATLDSAAAIHLTPIANWRQALSAGELHAAIEIPSGFADSIAAHHSTALTVHYNAAKERSGQARTKIERALRSYQEAIVAKRFEALDADTSLLQPFVTRIENVATSEEMSGFVLGKFLGYLLIIMAMMGAFYPAIDLTAGEKERGTLETLLVSPAYRSEIVYGKFFAVLSVSMITTLLNIGAMGATFSWGMRLGEAGPMMGLPGFGITPTALVSVAVILLPMAVFFSAICMAVATPARSYKEGQNLLTPLYMIVILPAIVSVLPGVAISPTLSLVPIVNTSLLTKEFLVGRYPLVESLLTFMSSCVLAGLSLRWAISQFQRESVLFRHAEELRWSPFRRPLIAQPLPSASGALFIYAVVLILVFFVGSRWQSANLLKGLLYTEIFLILFPPLIALRWSRNDVRRSLGLGKPSATIWFLSLLFAVGGWLLAIELASIQNLIFPIPSSLIKQFESLFAPFNALPPWRALFYIALLPAVCEELLCRGYLLQAWLPRMGKTRALIAVSIVFGILHLNPYRFLPTAFLGVVLGILAVETRSIFPAMLGHALCNTLTFFAQRQEEALSKMSGLRLDEMELLPWGFVAGALVLVAAAWWWLRRAAAHLHAETTSSGRQATPPNGATPLS